MVGDGVEVHGTHEQRRDSAKFSQKIGPYKQKIAFYARNTERFGTFVLFFGQK